MTLAPAAAEALSFRAKLGTLFLLTTLFFFGYMNRIILGPMLPTVEADLLINHVRSGSMFFMISLGLSLAAFGSGFVNSKIGHRNTIIASFFVSRKAIYSPVGMFYDGMTRAAGPRGLHAH